MATLTDSVVEILMHRNWASILEGLVADQPPPRFSGKVTCIGKAMHFSIPVLIRLSCSLV